MTRRDAAILGLTEGLLVIPPVVDLAMSGSAGAFRYFAADAFYYFTVGRNFARLGFPTFDQTYPTNGFHPLWQLWVALLYKLTLVFSLPETTFLLLAVFSCVLLIAAGVLLLGLAIRRARGEIPTLFVLVPVGVYALVVLPIWAVAQFGYGLVNPGEGTIPLYGTMWSYMNGMESGLSVCLFGAAAYAFVVAPADRRSSAAATGLALSALVLARLDLALLVAPLILLTLERYRRNKEFGKAVLFAACAGAPIAAYLAINLAYAGAAMPVSGAAKSTFPYPSVQNLTYFDSLFRNPFGFGIWLDVASRFAQMLVPAAAAVVVLWSRRRALGAYLRAPADDERDDHLDRFLVAIGVGVLLLALYDLVFTTFIEVGHWYFPVSILWLTLVVVCRPSGAASSLARFEFSASAIVALVTVLVFVGFHRLPGYHVTYERFYFVEAPQVRAAYGASPPKLIEVDDGIIAFSTGFPAMSGVGLALDPEAAKAFKEKRRLDVCLARGYDRLTTLVYGDFSSPEHIGQFCAGWVGTPQDVAAVRPVVEYIAPSGDFGVVRLERAAP